MSACFLTSIHTEFIPLSALLQVLRYYLAIIRMLLLIGLGIEAIQGNTIALAIFGIVILGTAALRCHKRLVGAYSITPNFGGSYAF